MAQFKPMVKMYTDEPSVILKLKKGGKVHHKGVKGHGDHGHKSMNHAAGGHMHGAHHAFESEAGKSPKKPSLSARRRAMNPNLYAKGGKVAHKFDGGAMPVRRPMGAPAAAPAVTPMGAAALGNMTPAQRAARAALVRRALTGMKKGGHAGLEKHVAKLEKELKHHESMPAAKAHKKASGGEIDAAETKTTLKNSVKPFAKTKVVDGDRKDAAHGTGEVKEGKPGGYKRGGRAKDCYAMGGTIEGNEGKFENTKVVDGDHHDSAHGTGGVRMGNAGGFKRGGRMHHKADGGTIDKKLTRTTVEGGNWENRPANTSKPGKSNTKTGEVKEANAGGYRHGGHASKKAYATGGNVVDDGKAVKYPRHFVSQPVANSLQSGTFKRGGKVKRHADGGMASGSDGMGASRDTVKLPTSAYENQTKQYMQQIPVAAQQKAYKDWRESETADNEAFVNAMKSLPKDIYEKIKGVFSSSPTTTPAGGVTKTEKSVTVTPAKRRGGKVR